MRVVITGATGFIGSALCARLADAGHLVIAVTRRADAGLQARYDTRRVDDGQDRRAWRAALVGADAVVHLAARAHRGEAVDVATRSEFRAINVEQTRALIAEALPAGVRRIVFMSSSKVYGETSGTLADGTPQRFGPGCIPAPRGPYGESKLLAETLLRESCESAGVALTILRPPLVYGPGVKGNLYGLLRVLDREVPLPLASVRNLRSLVSRDTLIEAVVRGLRAELPGTRIFPIADLEISTPALVRLMARALEREARLWPMPVCLLRSLGHLTGRGGAIGRLVDSFVLDPTAIRAALGWNPQASAEAAWRAVAVHYRAAREQ
jgi:UDP-glucose 4-epimerase